MKWDGLDILDQSVYSSMVTGPQGLLGVIFPRGFNPIFSHISVAMLQRSSSAGKVSRWQSGARSAGEGAVQYCSCIFQSFGGSRES